MNDCTSPHTMGSLLAICRDLDWSGTRDSTQLSRASALVAALDHLNGGPMPVDGVTEQVIDQLVVGLLSGELAPAQRRAARALSPATVNRYLTVLRVMLKRAVRLGWIDALPLFPERRTLRESESRDLVLQPAWLTGLCRRLQMEGHYDYAQLVAFVADTGCRLAEALALRWERIDTDGDRPTVQFVATKGGKARRVPLRADALQAIAAARLRPGTDDGPWGGDNSTYQRGRFRRAYDKAVAATCAELGLSERVREQWCIHTLRHTCLSRLAADGLNAFQIMKWAGHQDITTSQRYVHSSAVDLWGCLLSSGGTVSDERGVGAQDRRGSCAPPATLPASQLTSSG